MKNISLILLFFALCGKLYSQSDSSKAKVAEKKSRFEFELAVFSNIPVFSFAKTDNNRMLFSNGGAKTGSGADMQFNWHLQDMVVSAGIGYCQNPYEFKWFPASTSSSYYALTGNYSQVSVLMSTGYKFKLSPTTRNLFYMNVSTGFAFLTVGGDYKDLLKTLDLSSTEFNTSTALGLGFILKKVDLGFRFQSTTYNFLKLTGTRANIIDAYQSQLRLGYHF